MIVRTFVILTCFSNSCWRGWGCWGGWGRAFRCERNKWGSPFRRPKNLNFKFWVHNQKQIECSNWRIRYLYEEKGSLDDHSMPAEDIRVIIDLLFDLSSHLHLIIIGHMQVILLMLYILELRIFKNNLRYFKPIFYFLVNWCCTLGDCILNWWGDRTLRSI